MAFVSSQVCAEKLIEIIFQLIMSYEVLHQLTYVNLSYLMEERKIKKIRLEFVARFLYNVLYFPHLL